MPCLYVFISLVFVLTTSATCQHNTPQQVGVRIKTAPRIDKLYMLQGSLGLCILSTHLTRQVGSLPLAKNAKHSSSYLAARTGVHGVNERKGQSLRVETFLSVAAATPPKLESYFILAFALYTAEASLRAAAVGTTPSSPLQRRAKQSHGCLGFELYAYAEGSGGVLNI